MDRFPEFVANHLFLFSLLAMILAMLIWNLYADVLSGMKQVSATEAVRLINHEQAAVIDVRSEDDFKTGHILGAVHVPAGEFSGKRDKLEKFRKQAVIMYCNNGAESTKMTRLLMQDGFEKVYCLKGGIATWKNATLPLTRETA